MQVRIEPSNISGSIQAPGSKSFMQRACAAALLAHGTSTIIHPSFSNDDLAAIAIIKELGAEVDFSFRDKMLVRSRGVQPVGTNINCGESGLSSRMFTPIAALSDLPLSIAGDGSLLSRPMNFFDEVLPLVGVKCKSNDGRLPLNIQGPLQPSEIQIDGSISSQFITGLLMAYGASVTRPATIKVNNATSTPYIDMTLQVMEAFGCTVQHDAYERFYFVPGEHHYLPAEYTIEGDWSSAAFLLVAGAVAGMIKVTGLNIDSVQADKAILEVLKQTGCVLRISHQAIEVSTTGLSAFHFDATSSPDLFPPVAVLAAYCSGVSIIKGIHRLAHKESDRAKTLQQELGKMGVPITLDNDTMIISGGGKLKGANVHAHNDHRIAMACAIAALKADGKTLLDGAESVEKSYKAVYNHLFSLGASVHVV